MAANSILKAIQTLQNASPEVQELATAIEKDDETNVIVAAIVAVRELREDGKDDAAKAAISYLRSEVSSLYPPRPRKAKV